MGNDGNEIFQIEIKINKSVHTQQHKSNWKRI